MNALSIEQEKRRAQYKAQKEKNIQQKKDTARNVLVGELVIRGFPEISRFQLQRTKVANEIEFAPVMRFIKLLAADTEYTTSLKKRVAKDLQTDSQS